MVRGVEVDNVYADFMSAYVHFSCCPFINLETVSVCVPIHEGLC